LSGFLLDAEKTYVVTAQIGVRTDTGDADGQDVEQSAASAVDEAGLRAAMAQFLGTIEQVPPMYSALKRGGVRLYELARAGEQVEREPRPVTIHELQIEHFDPVRPVLRVRCSKGTYVRTLIEDIAGACGTLAHVVALRRTAVGAFSAGQLVSLERVREAAEAGESALDALLRPMDEAVADWPAVELGPHEAYYLRQGHAVAGGPRPLTGRVRLYAEGHRFLGVGEALGDGRVAPRRLLVNIGGGR
jgi:tRNA pseudouridine55 synthase